MEKENLTFDQLPSAVSLLSRKLESIEKLLIKRDEQPPQDSPDSLLTIEEAAGFLHLSKATLYSKVSKGELPVMKRSKRLYFSKKELLDYLKAGRKKSNAEIETEAENYLTPKNGRK